MMASNAGKVECGKLLLDMGAEVSKQKKVSCVIIDRVHAMQHTPRVHSSGC